MLSYVTHRLMRCCRNGSKTIYLYRGIRLDLPYSQAQKEKGAAILEKYKLTCSILSSLIWSSNSKNNVDMFCFFMRLGSCGMLQETASKAKEVGFAWVGLPIRQACKYNYQFGGKTINFWWNNCVFFMVRKRQKDWKIQRN